MSRTCYWPNNAGIASSHTPCYNETGESFCCDSQHYCFDNGLCLDTSEMTTYRGSCTDQLWATSSCPKYCYENYIGVSGVWVCNNNNEFACDPADCQNSTNVFVVPSGTIVRTNSVDRALGINNTSNASSIPLTSNTAVSCPNQSATIAGLGAGLGAALLIALVSIVVLLFLLREAQRRSSRQTYSSSATLPSERIRLKNWRSLMKRRSQRQGQPSMGNSNQPRPSNISANTWPVIDASSPNEYSVHSISPVGQQIAPNLPELPPIGALRERTELSTDTQRGWYEQYR